MGAMIAFLYLTEFLHFNLFPFVGTLVMTSLGPIVLWMYGTIILAIDIKRLSKD